MSDSWIEDGGVTTPLGFEAGGTYAGIKKFGDAKDRKDVGLRGIEDARAMASAAAAHLGIETREVLVASTGVIARPLPLDRVRDGIVAIKPSPEGGLAFSQAIL